MSHNSRRNSSHASEREASFASRSSRSSFMATRSPRRVAACTDAKLPTPGPLAELDVAREIVGTHGRLGAQVAQRDVGRERAQEHLVRRRGRATARALDGEAARRRRTLARVELERRVAARAQREARGRDVKPVARERLDRLDEASQQLRAGVAQRRARVARGQREVDARVDSKDELAAHSTSSTRPAWSSVTSEARRCGCESTRAEA
jgi:hypothetical protein